MKTLRLAAFALVLACMQASAGNAASLPCDRAKSPAERSICDGWWLQQLDRRMSRKFYALIQRVPKDWTFRLRHEQKDWVARRDACGANRFCLRWKYRQRIHELNRWARKFGLDL
jgi:uncharacterized protein